MRTVIIRVSRAAITVDPTVNVTVLALVGADGNPPVLPDVDGRFGQIAILSL